VLVIAIVIAAVIARRIGPLRRTTSFREPVFGDHELSAAQYRKNADDYAASSQWALAVRERLRAIARELEERGMLDPRPSRTAAELCRDASAQRPDLSQNLREATSAFDAIWYGGRTAGPADDELLRALDHRLVVPGRLAVLGHR